MNKIKSQDEKYVYSIVTCDRSLLRRECVCQDVAQCHPTINLKGNQPLQLTIKP